VQGSERLPNIHRRHGLVPRDLHHGAPFQPLDQVISGLKLLDQARHHARYLPGTESPHLRFSQLAAHVLEHILAPLYILYSEDEV